MVTRKQDLRELKLGDERARLLEGRVGDERVEGGRSKREERRDGKR